MYEINQSRILLDNFKYVAVALVVLNLNLNRPLIDSLNAIN